MFQYHCLNPIAEKGLGLFDEEYKKSEDLQHRLTDSAHHFMQLAAILQAL